jgi:hypothetical protein
MSIGVGQIWTKEEDELLRTYVKKYGVDLLAFINYQLTNTYSFWKRSL